MSDNMIVTPCKFTMRQAMRLLHVFDLRKTIRDQRKRITELEAERLELRKLLGWAYDLDEYKDNPEERER